MIKATEKIYIILIAISGLLFPVSFALAQTDNLVAEFEQSPLFSEANFLPGGSVTRWIKVTNNSEETQRIAIEAINVSDPDRLGDVLNLEIKEGETTLYNDALSEFFFEGEEYLSDLAHSATTQYDFTVSFYTGAGDAFQEKNLGFDILIGFQGTEGGILPGAGSGGGGGGGGGGLPAGLTIQDQSVKITDIGETSVTITWLTSYHSTSQVVYGKAGESHTLDLTDTSGSPPKYGYAHTTPEYDISSKVTFHSVTITGLTPDTTYYYRTISHASLAISQEYNFSTLASKQEPGAGLEAGTSGLSSPEAGEGVLAGTAPAPSGGIVAGAAVAATGEIGAGEEGGQAQAETAEEAAGGQAKESTEPKEISGNIFGAIGGFLGRGWIAILVIFLIALAVLLFLRQKKRKKMRPL